LVFFILNEDKGITLLSEGFGNLCDAFGQAEGKIPDRRLCALTDGCNVLAFASTCGKDEESEACNGYCYFGEAVRHEATV